VSENIDVKADLKLLEDELIKLQDELAKVENSRTQLLQKLHQVSGAAAYLRGKLTPEEQETVMTEEQTTEEKPEETTEEESEG